MLNWKIAVILLLLFSATAATRAMLSLDMPKQSRLENLEAVAINPPPLPQGEPIDGPGGPH